MKKSIRTILIILNVAFFSCDDVLEEDISEDTLNTITPSENIIIEGNIVQFNWEEVEDADDYNIVIRDINNVIVLDSTVVNTVFDYELESEAYKWQVRAQNFAYETPFTNFINFSVIPFSDLENTEVNLESPTDLLATNSITNFRFSWDAIDSAIAYDFEILKSDTDEIVYSRPGLTVTEFTIDDEVLTEDNTYKWQVRAINTSSNSDFFFRTLEFDTNTPPEAVLLTPSTSDALNNNEAVSFTWQYNDLADQTDITSFIEVSSDDNFSVILDRDTENTANTFSYTPTVTGTYYWRVIGTDAANNQGEYSPTGVFIVN